MMNKKNVQNTINKAQSLNILRVILSFLVSLSFLELPSKLAVELPSFLPLKGGKQETGIQDNSGINLNELPEVKTNQETKINIKYFYLIGIT